MTEEAVYEFTEAAPFRRNGSGGLLSLVSLG